MSEFETLLTALLNGETVDFEPKSRIEKYLKNCCDRCGCEGLPTPTTRAEALLYQLAEQLAGGGGSGATAYHLPSVNDLPTSAVNGSIAIVGNDDILGSWRFNRFINLVECDYGFSFMCSNENDDVYNMDNLFVLDEGGYLCLYYADSSQECTIYDTSAKNWSMHRNITVTSTPEAEAETWIRANAKKLNDLYIRENGKWAYKGTTSEAISAEYY